MTRHITSNTTSVVDGISGDENLAELWASKLKTLLNTNTNNYSCCDFSQLINENVSVSTLSELSVTVTPVDVSRALKNLKSGKKDNDNLSSDHLRHATSVYCCSARGFVYIHSRAQLHAKFTLRLYCITYS